MCVFLGDLPLSLFVGNHVKESSGKKTLRDWPLQMANLSTSYDQLTVHNPPKKISTISRSILATSHVGSFFATKKRGDRIAIWNLQVKMLLLLMAEIQLTSWGWQFIYHYLQRVSTPSQVVLARFQDHQQYDLWSVPQKTVQPTSSADVFMGHLPSRSLIPMGMKLSQVTSRRNPDSKGSLYGFKKWTKQPNVYKYIFWIGN